MFGRSQRRLLYGLLVVVLTGLLSFSVLLAQSDNRILEPESARTGTLDAEDAAQVYHFDSVAGATVNVLVETSAAPRLSVLLTDSNAEALAQLVMVEGAESVTLEDVALPEDGRYYVTVFATGLIEALDFDITLTVDAPEVEATASPEATEEAEATEEPEVETTPEPRVFAPGQVLTTSGLQIALSWQSEANLDLEIRDPVGGSLRFATPNVNSGGTFGTNINATCQGRVTNPIEQASWPVGAIPTGSYELLVYYQPLADCPTSDTVTFSINVTLDGQVLDSITSTVQPNDVFISSFYVNAEGQLSGGASGLYTDITVLPAPVADLLANPQPIASDVTVTDVLTSDNFYDTYSFPAQANDIVSIYTTAISGSLDTLVLLLDPNGNLIDANDDIEFGVTDSAIVNRRLILDGIYTIVATRYGKGVGGTEGGYTLLLSGATGDLPQELLDMNLPRGNVEVSLQWNTTADLQLLIRDPRGDSVYDDNIEVASGGRLEAAGNINCNAPLSSPVSYIYWPQNTVLLAGLYEIEVWYQNQCNDTSPVTFTLNALVNGQQVFVETAQPAPDEIYVVSVLVDVNGNVTVGEGGFIGTRARLDSNTLNFRSQIEAATPIVPGQTLNGSITSDNKFDLYTFAGRAGDVISASLARTTGNLDTVLFLVDPNGIQLSHNDDVIAGTNTDSYIGDYQLTQDGPYILIATHFGLGYGGTTGTYTLTLSSTSAE